MYGKLIVVQPKKLCPVFYETKSFSQQPANGPSRFVYWRSILILYSHKRIDIPGALLSASNLFAIIIFVSRSNYVTAIRQTLPFYNPYWFMAHVATRTTYETSINTTNQPQLGPSWRMTEFLHLIRSPGVQRSEFTLGFFSSKHLCEYT
jgi:hypothetical protein